MSYVTNYKIVKPFYEKLDISFILKTIITLKIRFPSSLNRTTSANMSSLPGQMFHDRLLHRLQLERIGS